MDSGLEYWKKRFAEKGKLAVGYVGWQTEERMAEKTAELAAALEPHLDEAMPDGVETLLDYGCGWGRFSEFLGDFCGEYIGVDLLPEHIEIARSTWGHERGGRKAFWPLSVASVKGDGPLHRVVDVVFTANVLQHITVEGERKAAFRFISSLQPKVCLFYELCKVPDHQRSHHITVMYASELLDRVPGYDWEVATVRDGEHPPQKDALFVGKRKDG